MRRRNPFCTEHVSLNTARRYCSYCCYCALLGPRLSEPACLSARPGSRGGSSVQSTPESHVLAGNLSRSPGTPQGPQRVHSVTGGSGTLEFSETNSSVCVLLLDRRRSRAWTARRARQLSSIGFRKGDRGRPDGWLPCQAVVLPRAGTGTPGPGPPRPVPVASRILVEGVEEPPGSPGKASPGPLSVGSSVPFPRECGFV